MIRLHRFGGYILARASINTRHTGMFLIDTGSTFNVVTPWVADQENLPSVGKGIANGIAGSETFTFRQADRLTVADISLIGAKLAEIDLYRFTRSLGRPVSGIIGFNAFGSAPFQIDYAKSTLTVHNPDHFSPDKDAISARYRIFGGVPVVRVVIGDGHPVWLVVDTGADVGLTLPQACLRDWPDIVAVSETGPGRSRGIGGSINNIQTWVTSIELFGVGLRHVPVSFESTPIRSRGLYIGRIGSPLLRNFLLTFEPTQHRIWAKWSPLDTPLTR